MCKMQYLLLFFVIYDTTAAVDRLSGIDYLGRGFDYIDDDPDNLNGGRTVINLSYSQGKLSSDQKMLVPDNVDALPENSCSIDASTATIRGETSYQKSYLNRVSSGLGVTYKSFALAFTGSKSYLNAQTTVFNSNSVVVAAASSCVNYIAQFESHANMVVSDTFQAEVLKLPSIESKEAYEEFFGLYGTHFISKVWLGTLQSVDQILDENIWKEIYNKTIDVDTVAKFGWEQFVGVGSQVTSNSNETTVYACVYKSSRIKCAYNGVPTLPPRGTCEWIQPNGSNLYPIKIDLSDISYLIDQRYIKMGNQSELLLRQNLAKNYLKSYCGFNQNCNPPEKDKIISSVLPSDYKYVCANLPQSSASPKPIFNFVVYLITLAFFGIVQI